MIHRSIWLILLVCACSKPAPAPTPDAGGPATTLTPTAGASARRVRFPPPHDVDANGFPKIEGLPDSLTCAADAECEVALPPDASGCCTLSNAAPMTKAYRSAVAAWAKAHCSAYECPASPLPGALPAPCFFEPRCVAKRCTHACSAGDGGGPLRGTHGMSDTTAP